MKYLIISLWFLIPISGIGQQTNNSLSELLWKNVSEEARHLSFLDSINELEFYDYKKVDDSKNGYLSISGSGDCGCPISSTVGAFRNTDGDYTILQTNTEGCNWEKAVSSNKELENILPNDFGIKDFIFGDFSSEIDHPIFFINFEIPQEGTDTKVKIELIPFGLEADGVGLTCFSYQEKFNNNFLKDIGVVAKQINDVETLDFLLKGEFNKISKRDNDRIVSLFEKNEINYLFEGIQENLIKLKKIYDVYNLLNHTELTLDWDRRQSRFFIKEYGNKSKQNSFREFLINNKYWEAIC